MKSKILALLFCTVSLCSYAEGMPVSNLIDPLMIHFESNKIHIISYFTDHDEYECIEAMIKSENDIRVILTYKDKTQIDYLNNEQVFLTMKEESKNRKVVLTPIDCIIKTSIKKPEISMQFITENQEKVSWFFKCVGKPSKKYAGLVNPEGHSEGTSFPVMYREKSTLAGTDTKLVFDGQEMNIPIEVDKAPFFVGLKSYYSESFSMGVIRKSDDAISIKSTPKKYEIGEKWIYEINGVLFSYEIVAKNKDDLTIRSSYCIIDAEIENESLVIEDIQYLFQENNTLVVSFTPALQICGISGVDSSFSIAICKHGELVKGTVKTITNGNECLLQVIPQTPDWANKRLISIKTVFEEENATRNCTIE